MASDWIFLFLKKWDSEPSRSTRLGCNGLTYLHNFQSVVPTKQLKDTGRQWASSKGHGNSRLFIGDPAFQKGKGRSKEIPMSIQTAWLIKCLMAFDCMGHGDKPFEIDLNPN